MTESAQSAAASAAAASASRIPAAHFIEDVLAHLGSPDEPIEPAMAALNELASKYKFMEIQLASRLQAIESKMPEIEQTLEMVKALSDPATTPELVHFELNDTLYAEAKLGPGPIENVSLWLGANVMLDYSLAEAQNLLQSRLEGARKSRDALESELEFLREQITTVQVNTSRLYNFDVIRRRQASMKSQAGANGSIKSKVPPVPPLPEMANLQVQDSQ